MREAEHNRGRLFVVSGPSGVGKGTVIKALLGSHSCPPSVVKCITATTRLPRPDEVNGKHYLFFDEAEFEARVRSDYFIEHVEYNGRRYGTPKEEVEKRLAAGLDVILEIEVRGGLTIKDRIADSVLVFLAPPSMDELTRRLTSRATDDDAAVAGRLRIAREEMKAAPRYDHCIVNDDLARAVEQLRQIIIESRD